MRIDWGVNPSMTKLGVFILGFGLAADVWLFFYGQHVNLYVGFLVGLLVGIGAFVLAREIGYTRRIRRQAREWARSQEGLTDDERTVEQLADEKIAADRRYEERHRRAARKAVQRQRAPITEDHPGWRTYVDQVIAPKRDDDDDD